MVVAGLLVMDSRAGTLIYSQRFSPAYGLTSCDQGAARPSPRVPRTPSPHNPAVCARSAGRDASECHAVCAAPERRGHPQRRAS